MASRKYLGDYRLENIEKNGKLKTEAVYRGAYYRFADADALKGSKNRLTVLAAVFWVAEFAALTLRTNCAHYVYAIMPMVFAMPPFWFAGLGFCAALTALKNETSPKCGERERYMKREQAEKIGSRFAGGSLIAAVLSGASFAGSLIAIISAGAPPSGGDILFALCASVQAAAAALCFARRGVMKTEAVADGA